MIRLTFSLLFAVLVFGADVGRQYMGFTSSLNLGGTAGNSTTYQLNDSAKRVGVVFQSETSSQIRWIGLRQSASTGTGRACTFSLMALNASGNPDGTPLTSGALTTDASNVYRTAEVNYTPAVGQKLALVVGCDADASNTVSFYRGLTDSFSNRRLFPYSVTYDGTSWTKSASIVSSFYYATDAKIYGLPYSAHQNYTASTSTPQVAVKFSLPAASCSTFVVRGFSGAFNQSPLNSSEFQVAAWDEAGIEIAGSASESFTDQHDSMSNGSNFSNGEYLLGTPITLTCGVSYRIGLKRVLGSSMGMVSLSFESATLRSAVSSWHVSTHNGTSWTDVEADLPLWNLIVTDITAPAGGGGGEHAYPIQ